MNATYFDIKKISILLILAVAISCNIQIAITESASNSWIYQSEEYPISFSVPNEWICDASGDDTVFYLSSEGQKSHPTLTLSVEDVWNKSKELWESLGLKREDINNNGFDLRIFAQNFGIHEDDMAMVKLGDYEYISFYVGNWAVYGNCDNGYLYLFAYSGKTGYVEEVEAVIKTVIHNTTDTPKPVSNISATVPQQNNAQSWLFIDEENGCSFWIPTEWSIMEKKDSLNIVRSFSLTQAGDKSVSVMSYSCNDVWENSHAPQGWSRSMMNNNVLSYESLAETYNVDINDVRLVSLGDYWFYRVYIDNTVLYIQIENGYMYTFVYGGETKYIDEVESVISTMDITYK